MPTIPSYLYAHGCEPGHQAYMEAFVDLARDVWDFLKVRKKFWLAPLIITIVLMGALIVFTQGSVVAPFIYSIF